MGIITKEPMKFSRCNICGSEKNISDLYFTNRHNSSTVVTLCQHCQKDLMKLLKPISDGCLLNSDEIETVKYALVWFYNDLNKMVTGESQKMVSTRVILSKLGVEGYE